MKSKSITDSNLYEIRLKTPVLRVVCFVLLGSGLLIFISAILNHHYLNILIDIIMISLVGLSLFLLKKDRYKHASNLVALSVSLGLFFILQTMKYGEHSTSQMAASSCFIVVFCGVFLNGKKALYLFIILCSLNLLVYLARIFFISGYTELTTSIINQMISAVITFPLVAVLIALLRNIMDKVITDSQNRLNDSLTKTETLNALANEAQNELKMAQSMEEQAQETAASSVQIEKNVRNIADGVGSLKGKYDNSIDSFTQIKDKMTELLSVANDQASNITETSASMEEMAASIKNITNIIENKAEAVSFLRQTAHTGMEKMTLTSSSFSEVLQYIESVKDMVKLIANIGQKTNLLAMNAAIEAAHAGEAGKGFAVVADEVRKLSESSAANSKQITDTLKKLINALEKTEGNVADSGKSFIHINEEIEKVGLAMDEIKNSIKEISVGSDEVLKATSSMIELTDRVNQAISSTQDFQKNGHDNVKELGDFIFTLHNGMEEINTGSTLIRTAAEELSRKSNAINEFIREFNKKLVLNEE